ncbi:MAG: VOC family protein [Ilumatobacteraceae bacterium]
MLRVPEVKQAKNRMHLDIRVAGDGPWDLVDRQRLIRPDLPRLVGLGATVVREETEGKILTHGVMHDPEGNKICVA